MYADMKTIRDDPRKSAVRILFSKEADGNMSRKRKKQTDCHRPGATCILLVDDHPIVRRGLRELIEQEPDLDVCGEAEEVAEALRLVGELKPDVVIVDITLKGRSGLEFIKDMRARKRSLPILVLSVHDEATYAERALKAGAQGYVMKREAPDLIIDAIRTVLSGELYVCEKMATKLLSRIVGRPPKRERDDAVAALSDRELEVLELLGRGHSTRRVAEELHLSVSTIETYRANIKHKLGLESASELVRFATEWGLGAET